MKKRVKIFLLVLLVYILIGIALWIYSYYNPQYNRIISKIILFSNPVFVGIASYYMNKNKKKELHNIFTSNSSDKEKIEQLKEYGLSRFDYERMKKDYI